MDRLLKFTALVCLGAMVCPEGLSAARSSHAELATTATAVVERGFHAELPPHISTLLGLTREESCAVMQGVLRSAGKVEGIDVAEKNHNDVVIFVVDEADSRQMLFLTSPSGVLRRMLVVEKGIGRVVRASKADVEVFQAEKKRWRERMGVWREK